MTEYREMLLLAGLGGSSGDATCMMMSEGFCVPLAATEDLRDLVEARGESETGEMLDEAGVPFPPSGGLWVLECGITYDSTTDDSDTGWHARRPTWRRPTQEEVAGLLDRQMMRATGVDADPPAHGGRWAFLGALV